MSCSAIHHVEMCLRDARPTLHLFTHGLGFTVVGGRTTPTCEQWVLRQHDSTFVVTQRRYDDTTSGICNGSKHTADYTTLNNNAKNDSTKQLNGYHCSTRKDISKLITSDYSTNEKLVDHETTNNENVDPVKQCYETHCPDTSRESSPLAPVTAPNGHTNVQNIESNESERCGDGEEWTVFCCQGKSSSAHVDSVFNSALAVRDVAAVVRRVEQRGGRVIKQPRVVRDDHGEVTYAIIATLLGNAVHTLIDRRHYRGPFLPGFTMLHGPTDDAPCNDGGDGNTADRPVSTHLDHVAYICEEGRSAEIIQWYEEVLNMKRFLVNSEEDITEGLSIEDEVGLRLKALEYWKCFETGLYRCEDGQDTSLKIVIGEPITAIKGNHVSAFLECHGGAGLQHIALHSPAMLNTVRAMAARGVPFRQPPPTYYAEVGKLEELVEVGLGAEADALMAAGVLLDTEADPPDQQGDSAALSKRYLMQIFTEPIFGTNTFFLEVVHRAGAAGFGVGNITALARSIALHLHQPLALGGGVPAQS